MEKIGRYQVLKQIAKGGMGEVYLVHDPVCARQVALKRARPDLKNQEAMLKRFLHEARTTAKLSHPSVVPIYTIHQDEDQLYYTMPYIEGKTLKDLLKEKTPIPALMRIYLSLCHAISYAHSQNVLHRDIKPENVMVGAHGEVYILDWGLAKQMGEAEEVGIEEGDAETTVPGKVFGTVAYMAPERALSHPATPVSDVYALGMILYEILSLHRLFKRGSLKEFRKSMHQERWVEPSKIAPLRNVPRMLATIAHKCLNPRMLDRYQSVEELTSEIEYYLEGRSEWFEIAGLHPQRKGDWQFQENIYLPNQMEITEGWVGMMISKDSYTGNTRVEGRIRIRSNGNGLGLLIGIPEGETLKSGYCLWLGREGARLFRSSVQVAFDPELTLTCDQWHSIRLEKVDNGLHFYLDGALRLSYISHLPLAGKHIGFLYTDEEYEIDELDIHVGSYSIRVNCLAIPDALLAGKHYDDALIEYRRIAGSFPERDEGREARFRAGITLLEQQKYDEAIQEFGKLHKTPGAPLEYLGKALVFKAQKEYAEEAKCFELAFRKYPNHPLLPLLEEELIFRLHASQHDRIAYFRLALIATHYLGRETPFDKKELAYLLARPHLLQEMGASMELLKLGQLTEDLHPALIIAHRENLTAALDHLEDLDKQGRNYLAELALATDQAPLVHKLGASDLYNAWAYLFEDKWQEAGKILDNYPIEDVVKEDTMLHFIYGCYLAHTEGEEIAMAHFSAASDTAYPKRWELLGQYLVGNPLEELLPEKRELYRQLHLYYHCLGDEEKTNHFSSLAKQTTSQLLSADAR